MRTMAKRVGTHKAQHARMTLGSFEASVMDVIWKTPECTVWQVKSKLHAKRAYNTVMTTMVRLFNKGLLTRHKQGHSFVYSAQLSLEDWGRLAASELVDRLAAVPNVTHELLLSSLLNALDDLNPKLQTKMKAQIVGKRPR